ncbi:MAG: polysaccharide biosynthesis/export family protein [Cyanobacteria bacterium P01_G01_bin.38]
MVNQLCRGLLSGLTLGLAFSLTGVSSAQELVPPLPPSVSPSAQDAPANEYVLGPGDEVAIAVVGYPEFEDSYEILPDGNVMLPLVGAVNFANKTPNQVTQELTLRLQRYLVEPMVTIRLTNLRPVVVSVTGEVHRPGPIALSALESSDSSNSAPTLSGSLLAAGGVTRDADLRSVSIRRALAGGQTQEITINLWEALSLPSEGAIDNIVLRDGDSIVVPSLGPEETLDRRLVASSSLAPEQIRVRVVGEVIRPGEVQISPTSSVSGAVAAAGGPTEDAKLGEVALVRLDEAGEVQEEVLDLTNLVDNHPVQEGDVVVISKRGYISVFDNITRFLGPFNLFRLLGF